MCTLFLAAHVVPGGALVVAANRDERLDRPASPPMAWAEGFVAPRDEVAGGTWLGVNAHGVFVAITNRHLGALDVTRISRGELVRAALLEPSARDVHARMARVDPRRHNGFHLVYADGRDVLATVSDGVELAQVVLGSGVHIVTERSFGAGDDRARTARIEQAWSRIGGSAARLPELLAEHDAADPMTGTCIHLPQATYGTRSSVVLTIPEVSSDAAPGHAAPSALGGAVMTFADGPPCSTAFQPYDLVAAPFADSRDAGKQIKSGA